MNSFIPIANFHSNVVSFQKPELTIILSLYGRMVASGEWRDYGISSLKEVAVFSIFRRTAEQPIYRIEKRPKLRNRQGQYAVVGVDGQILKRGHDLKSVLGILERKLIKLVDELSSDKFFKYFLFKLEKNKQRTYLYVYVF